MTLAELKKMNADELMVLLAESSNRLALLRRQAIEGQLKDVREIREVRQTIARINTMISASRA